MKSESYKTYSREAVKAEQEQRYLDAARHWADAQRRTPVPKEIEYCQHRIDFCERHHFRLKSMLMTQEKAK